jgi:hypothetical protein
MQVEIESLMVADNDMINEPQPFQSQYEPKEHALVKLSLGRREPDDATMATADLFPDISIGYPKLAARVEIQPELSIYRRFGALNAQNLLYFQAQLTDLEARLRRQQGSDDASTHGKKSYYARTWFRLEDSVVDGDTKQLDLVLKIRGVLKDFSKYA